MDWRVPNEPLKGPVFGEVLAKMGRSSRADTCSFEKPYLRIIPSGADPETRSSRHLKSALGRTRSWCSVAHRPGGEKVAGYSAHVDVPTFALRGFNSGQIAHGREAGFQVSTRCCDHELTPERIDGDVRFRDRPVAIGEPKEDILE